MIDAARLAEWRDAESRLDPRGMRGHVEGLPAQVATAAAAARAFAADLPARDPVAIAVAGMGGSAIGADLAAAATDDRRARPLVAVRGWALPAWLDDRAFLLAVSYSGNTAETLAAYREAKSRGIPAAAATTGGELAELARAAGDPVLDLAPGYPPRAALGWTLSAAHLVAARLDPGLDLDAEAGALEAAAGALAGRPAAWLAWDAGNPALDLAASIAGGATVVYGGHPIAVAAAYRWKCQINENAKLPAWSGAFPEVDHNEIVGFEADPEVLAGLRLVRLLTPWDDPRLAARVDFARRFCAGRVAAQHHVEARGETPLAGLLWLCLLGDCASFLASVIAGRDPTPVSPIDELKAELKGEPAG